MFRFVKKVFFVWLTILSGFANANSLGCVSMKIIVRSVFSEDGTFYPQLFLDDALYELV